MSYNNKKYVSVCRTVLRSLLLLYLASACKTVFAQEVVSSSLVSPGQPEFNILGFGDVSYLSNDGTGADGFAIGQAVVHLSALLGDSVSVFGEFSATASDSDFDFDVERVIVKYDFSDSFKLSAGRYHTPMGYWNSAFHHGAWLQTTVARPEMVRFGSSIVPIHFVGLLVEGLIPSGQLGLEYKAGLGNGRHANISMPGDAGDINGKKAVVLQLSSKPQALDGLDLGLSLYGDEVTPSMGPNIKESSAAAHMAWAGETPEVIVEYLHSSHELTTNSAISGDVNAWYAQFAYRLPGSNNAWKPYVRMERTRVDSSDPLLGAESLDYNGSILGVRWDLSPYAALKAEYRNEEFDNGGRENNFRLQIAIVLSRL